MSKQVIQNIRIITYDIVRSLVNQYSLRPPNIWYNDNNFLLFTVSFQDPTFYVNKAKKDLQDELNQGLY